MGYYDSLINSKIFCTQAMARLVRNDLTSYSLANLGALIGHKKDDTVEKYIDAHKLYSLVDNGKKQKEKLKHYDLVPFDIISAYGLRDGEVCFKLGEYIRKRLYEINEEQLGLGLKSNEELIKNEMALTKVIFKMEAVGIRINKEYCEEAFNYYLAEVNSAKKEFLELTGLEFSDSRKVLVPAFDKLALSYPKTEKGNASFKDEHLSKLDNPIANIIKKYRNAYKSAYTYYKNFIELSDKDGNIHTNLKQAGTTTGRMSCSAPNLQNVPKRKDTGKYKARAAFIPRKDYFFAMLDYDQMEYRLFMDYAEEIELINKVLSGLDVHTATAEMVETSRDVAKTINFLLLYGGGAGKLAGELGISIDLAKEYRNKYFQNLTAVKETSQLIVSTAENRGHIYNILGRRCFIPKKLAYKAPNYLIQGGCGDIVKRAMLSIDKFLEGKKSRMVLQIHDEILLEIHKDEYEIIDDIKEILVKSYEYKKLPLTAGADYSFTNWSEKRGLDYGEILNNLKAISAS
jgi:DNA polymerase-1